MEVRINAFTREIRVHVRWALDERHARYVNTALAGYFVPVNADVPGVDVILVPEVDHDVNPAGVKGLGELGNVGTAAAVAAALYHATGKRVRDLPIRLEHILRSVLERAPPGKKVE